MAMIKGTNANKTSAVPSRHAGHDNGNSGKNKRVLPGTKPAAQSVVPATKPLMSYKKNPHPPFGTDKMSSGKKKVGGPISSGGGSFGQG